MSYFSELTLYFCLLSYHVLLKVGDNRYNYLILNILVRDFIFAINCYVAKLSKGTLEVIMVFKYRVESEFLPWNTSLFGFLK